MRNRAHYSTIISGVLGRQMTTIGDAVMITCRRHEAEKDGVKVRDCSRLWLALRKPGAPFPGVALLEPSEIYRIA